MLCFPTIYHPLNHIVRLDNFGYKAPEGLEQNAAHFMDLALIWHYSFFGKSSFFDGGF